MWMMEVFTCKKVIKFLLQSVSHATFTLYKSKFPLQWTLHSSLMKVQYCVFCELKIGYILTFTHTYWGRDKMADMFPDNIFKCIFLNENCWILVKISLKYLRKDTIDNNPAWGQMMAWGRPGDKPLSEPMMLSMTRGYDVIGHTHWPCGGHVENQILNSQYLKGIQTVFTKIIRHIWHFRWLGPNVWWEIS